MARRVLVTGGTGAVGSAVVRALASRAEVTFTWHTREEAAIALARETGAAPVHLDLASAEGVAGFASAWEFSGFVHAAGRLTNAALAIRFREGGQLILIHAAALKTRKTNPTVRDTRRAPASGSERLFRTLNLVGALIQAKQHRGFLERG